MANRYTILPAATTSNTSSINTWSATSGGATGASVPISTDNAKVDALSVAGAAAIMNVDAALSCLDMDFTGATNNPTLAQPSELYIYGDITFIAAMTYTSAYFLYMAKAGGGTQLITTNTLQIPAPIRLFSGANVILQDDYSGTGSIYHRTGTFNTNGKTVFCLDIFDNGQVEAKTLTLGTSIITCSSFVYTGGTLTITPNNAVINISGTGALAAGNANYNGATFNCLGTAHTITGNPTGLIINFQPTAAQTITAAGASFSVSNASRTGTGVVTINGGTWTKTGGGTITLNNMAIVNSTAIPAATWYAAPNSINGGNNTGWLFNLVDATTLIQGGTARRIGLSTDTKPTGLNPGSRFWESDTDKYYITNDGTNWVPLRGKNYDSYTRNLYR